MNGSFSTTTLARANPGHDLQKIREGEWGMLMWVGIGVGGLLVVLLELRAKRRIGEMINAREPRANHADDGGGAGGGSGLRRRMPIDFADGW